MRGWQWYDWHIALFVVLAFAVLLLPFACWIFGWTLG